SYAERELDIDLVPVIKGLDRPPRWRISADPVTEAERCYIDAARRRDVDACLGLGILSPQRHELVLRITPGDRGHIGLPGRMRFDMIGPPVRRDGDVVHRQVRGVWLDQHVSLTGGPRPALGIPNLPLGRVPGGDRLQLLASVEGYISNVHRSDVELVQRPVAVRVDLDRIDIAGACRFDASGGVGEL